MLYYVEDTLEVPEDAKFEVEVMDNFFIEFRCGEPWDYSDDDQRRHRRIDENDDDDDGNDDDGNDDDGYDGDGNDDDQIKNPTKTNQFLVDLLGFQDFAEESDGTAKGKAYFRGTYDSLIELTNYIRVKVQVTNKTRLLRSLADEKVKYENITAIGKKIENSDDIKSKRMVSYDMEYNKKDYQKLVRFKSFFFSR